MSIKETAEILGKKATDSIPGITQPTGIEDGNTKPTAVDEPELQLLVLDMGDVCIVRVEKGHWDVSALIYPSDVWTTESTNLMRFPFSRIREVLGGEKPHTRLEKNHTEAEYRYKISWRSDTDYENWTTISDGEYTALSELAGKPLPIWEGGTWEELMGNCEHPSHEKINIPVWRYTR